MWDLNTCALFIQHVTNYNAWGLEKWLNINKEITKGSMLQHLLNVGLIEWV